ncbi:hypothetical protein PCASD_02269 [Puccinia coronata f. sp. avenae]|uniref:Uncharacterized protein n=1 Tax=Puccinia coronata f. sp. avenae TaxID=200324 RepID=A0A2N5VI18_9BASI|nr:hypothetical protein PCASD_02269 [Puccinia coronata f. sp. avenae]
MNTQRFALSAILGWIFVSYPILSAPWPKPHPALLENFAEIPEYINMGRAAHEAAEAAKGAHTAAGIGNAVKDGSAGVKALKEGETVAAASSVDRGSTAAKTLEEMRGGGAKLPHPETAEVKPPSEPPVSGTSPKAEPIPTKSTDPVIDPAENVVQTKQPFSLTTSLKNVLSTSGSNMKQFFQTKWTRFLENSLFKLRPQMLSETSRLQAAERAKEASIIKKAALGVGMDSRAWGEGVNLKPIWMVDLKDTQLMHLVRGFKRKWNSSLFSKIGRFTGDTSVEGVASTAAKNPSKLVSAAKTFFRVTRITPVVRGLLTGLGAVVGGLFYGIRWVFSPLIRLKTWMGGKTAIWLANRLRGIDTSRLAGEAKLAEALPEAKLAEALPEAKAASAVNKGLQRSHSMPASLSKESASSKIDSLEPLTDSRPEVTPSPSTPTPAFKELSDPTMATKSKQMLSGERGPESGEPTPVTPLEEIADGSTTPEDLQREKPLSHSSPKDDDMWL